MNTLSYLDSVIKHMAAREPTNFEKHIQTGIGAVVIALLLWSGNALTTLKEQNAVSAAQISALLTSINRDGGIYTINQANRDFGIYRASVEALEVRVRRLESKLENR